MVRRYDIEGTRSWLYGGIACIVIGLWCARDGWFPPPSVLEKHPDPDEGFYLFNQVFAVLFGLGALVSMAVHRLMR